MTAPTPAPEHKSVEQIRAEWEAIEARRPGGRFSNVDGLLTKADGIADPNLLSIIDLLHMTVRGYHAEMGILLTALAEAQAREARLREDLQRERLSHSNTIDQRDHAREAADRLAYALFDIDEIGEHSSANCPWANAAERLEALKNAVERLEALKGATNAE